MTTHQEDTNMSCEAITYHDILMTGNEKSVSVLAKPFSSIFDEDHFGNESELFVILLILFIWAMVVIILSLLTKKEHEVGNEDGIFKVIDE